MQDVGWTVKVANTEADLAIVIDVELDDIIISRDSDMIVYASIQTVWHPVSGGHILVYIVPDLLRTLDVTHPQLTALAVVSHNDYNRNIRSLSPVTNFSIIKSIKHAGNDQMRKFYLWTFLTAFAYEILTELNILHYLTDPKDIILAYLSDSQVVSKNTNSQDFAMSIRVFVDLQQTRVEIDGSQPSSQILFKQLQDRFQDFCT